MRAKRQSLVLKDKTKHSISKIICFQGQSQQLKFHEFTLEMNLMEKRAESISGEVSSQDPEMRRQESNVISAYTPFHS